MKQQASPFVWYDLMTSDVERATAFYSAVVGWKIEDSGMPGQSYSVLKAGDVMVGGLMAVPPASGLPPMWTAYIYSGDVDADTAKAVTLGGRECKAPADIPGVGRFSVVMDPSGAMFNLFTPSSAEGPGEAPANTPGHIGWRELFMVDPVKTWAFYQGLFGWTKSTVYPMGAAGDYQLFKTRGADDVGGMMKVGPQMPHPTWQLYFNVPALDAAIARVGKAGGTMLDQPMQVPGGQWVVHVRDPQGAVFGLVAPGR
jgi:predicted enzyme related to lactoylglutathione lyase